MVEMGRGGGSLVDKKGNVRDREWGEKEGWK